MMNGEILGPSKTAALYTGIEPVVQLTIEARIYVNAMMRTSTSQELGLESRWWVQTDPDIGENYSLELQCTKWRSE